MSIKTLEELIRAYDAKGELVHLSLAYSNEMFHCNFAAASPQGGYAIGIDKDPVKAILKAFENSPAKKARSRSAPAEDVDVAPPEVTATVNEKTGSLGEWTK